MRGLIKALKTLSANIQISTWRSSKRQDDKALLYMVSRYIQKYSTDDLKRVLATMKFKWEDIKPEDIMIDDNNMMVNGERYTLIKRK